MMTLVVGANGGTGRLLVEQLLEADICVRIIVRSTNNLPKHIIEHKNISIVTESILDIPSIKLEEYVSGCNAIVSCLGHNLSFKGLFGAPRNLVTSATEKLCKAAIESKPEFRIKFILMNTTGNANRDINENTPLSQRVVVFILRHLLPPHADNEKASDILRSSVGKKNSSVEWVVVRPDGLINEAKVTDYEEYPSPIRNAIFNSGQTSRINVANFMLKLITDEKSWNNWNGQMPVIYNKLQPSIA